MAAPSSRALIAWWHAQPRGDRTCTGCGRVDTVDYVQPQHPYYAAGRAGVALCAECINKSHKVAADTRKAYLASLPRCAGCRRRGTLVLTGSGVYLCRRHFQTVEGAVCRATNGLGGIVILTAAQVRIILKGTA